MVVIIRDRIQDMIRRNMTLDQIQAAQPTRDYDTEYVTVDSFVKANQFVEAMYRSLTKNRREMLLKSLLLVWLLAGLTPMTAFAQFGQSAPPPPPIPGRAGAPVDLTGTWVSVVSEDWRWRMTTPLKGDAASIPYKPAARRLIDAWDPEKDTVIGLECKAYGAPAIMRLPGPCAHLMARREHSQDRTRSRPPNPPIPL